MKKLNLIQKILIGMLIGVVIGIFRNTLGTEGLAESLLGSGLDSIKVFGMLFTGALKAVAPILVFFLIINTIASHQGGDYKKMASIITLYMIGTLIAALLAVTISFLHPITLTLTSAADASSAPSSLVDVFSNILNQIVDNPVNALATANYLGILSWAILIGAMLKGASQATKDVLNDMSEAITKIVRLIISFAPIGILGLVYQSIVETGIKEMLSYGSLLVNLLGAMAILAFVVNPLLTYIYTRENPYPLVFKCLKESGITAFFTRSSAANIPVNIDLAQRLDVDSELYNLSIPLGATINMGGAAITITTLTLAAAYSVGIEVSLPMAFVLSVLATVSACGASGVAGGSLLLIPLACSLFSIEPDVAAQVVGIGFIISVIQDSCETGLNSSSDILYTTLVDRKHKRLANKRNA